MGIDGEDLLGLTWPEKPDPQHPCSFAVEFQAYCDALLSRLTDLKGAELEVGIANAKRELLDRYLDFVTDTPPGHTNPAGRKAGKHRCIVDVLNDTGRQIRLHERSLPPPKLVPKVKTQPAAPEEKRRSWAEDLTEFVNRS